jgi:hypothetical protein
MSLVDDAERPTGLLAGGAQAVNEEAPAALNGQRRLMTGSAGDPQRLELFPSSLAWVARDCFLWTTDHLGSAPSPTSTTTSPTKERNK